MWIFNEKFFLYDLPPLFEFIELESKASPPEATIALWSRDALKPTSLALAQPLYTRREKRVSLTTRLPKKQRFSPTHCGTSTL